MATWTLLQRTKRLHIFTSSSNSIPIFNYGTSHLMSTKPNSLNQSLYRKQVSLSNLLQRYGFPPSKLQSFLNRNHFLLNSSLHDIESSLNVLLSFKVPHSFLVSLVSECPGVLKIESLKKWEMGFSKCGNFGVSPLVVRSVLEYSTKCEIDPDGFFRCLKVLSGLGLTEKTVRRVLEGFPNVIMMEETEISRRIEFLIRMGIERDGVDWVFYSFPAVLGYGVESKLVPLLDEFEALGFSKDLIRKEIVREPRILGMELGELSRCLELLRTLKCREPIKFKIFGNGEFRAGFEVKLRVDCLCKYGLIRREAFKVLWKEPRMIIYDIEDIDKKIDFLVNTMGFNVGCLVEVPEYLGVSFGKQILPRHKVIQYLLAKGGLGDEVRLQDMIKMSRLRFYNMYVKPYPECEKMFGRFSGDGQVKSQHRTGLWKLFRAQREPESKQEANNMKSFMEAIV